MIIRATDAQAKAILGSMLYIAQTHGGEGVSDADRATLYSAARIVLGQSEDVAAGVAPCGPGELADVTAGDEEDRVQALRMLAVMSVVDGDIDADKIALVQEYATALNVDEAYLGVLAESVAGELDAAAACMMRKNAETFPGLDLAGMDEDRIKPFIPYRDGGEDPELVARYEALGELPRDTFGWAFWNHFKSNGFGFPGDPNGLAEAFTTRHDSSHVLSSYSTSAQGELLVSTFIGAMHPDHPMAAEVLPALYAYHLGIPMNKIAQVQSGWFEPRKFWTAWDRGAATTTDVFEDPWQFWSHVEAPLADLRHDYGIPPVEPALVA
jgi:hypothetical protein